MKPAIFNQKGREDQRELVGLRIVDSYTRGNVCPSRKQAWTDTKDRDPRVTMHEENRLMSAGREDGYQFTGGGRESNRIKTSEQQSKQCKKAKGSLNRKKGTTETE